MGRPTVFSIHCSLQRGLQHVQQAFTAVRKRHFGDAGFGMAFAQAGRDGAANGVGGKGVFERVAGDQDVHGGRL